MIWIFVSIVHVIVCVIFRIYPDFLIITLSHLYLLLFVISAYLKSQPKLCTFWTFFKWKYNGFWNVVMIWTCIASNDRMTDQLKSIWNKVIMAPRHLLYGAKKVTRNVIQSPLCAGRDSNLVPLCYKSKRIRFTSPLLRESVHLMNLMLENTRKFLMKFGVGSLLQKLSRIFNFYSYCGVFAPWKNCWDTETSKHALNNRITSVYSSLLGDGQRAKKKNTQWEPREMCSVRSALTNNTAGFSVRDRCGGYITRLW
jgi:hypothetical protein